MNSYYNMTSRQRLLTALNCDEIDIPPCSFMMYKGLLSRSHDYLHFVQQQLELGLDTYVQIPPRPPLVKSDSYNLHGLPVRYHPKVEINEWKKTSPNLKWPLLFKEYHTPAGILRAEVYQDEEWPYGNHIPFLDDYIETRSRKYLISQPEDLEAIKFLLVPPTEAEIKTFQDETRAASAFARENKLLTVGGWGVGADLVGWVYGLQNMMYASNDNPDFLKDLLKLIAEWNRSRMEVVLKENVDLFIKRAWYENCDFWSPKTWQTHIYPILKEDVELVHSRGALFGYIITSNAMPLLDMIKDAGVDTIIGVDPKMWDLVLTKKKLNGKVCLWGGVNGHLTVEKGREVDVRSEVETAIRLLALGGGFILSPVDNVRTYTPKSKKNVHMLIKTWRDVMADKSSDNV
jgi:uroporphyrinogen-III decarboxylase